MNAELKHRLSKILMAHHAELGRHLVGARAYRDTHAEAAITKQREEIMSVLRELEKTS